MTVRTLETMIRLATAHAKLRLAQHVEITDLDLALKLLNMTIFREEEQEEHPQGDDEMQDADAEAAEQENDQVVPLKQKSGRAAR